MQINKAIFKNANGIPVFTVDGKCTVGHKRRMNVVEIEGPISLGESVEIEARNIGAFTSVGKKTIIKRTFCIGRFVTIGESCRIGEQGRMDNVGLSNSYVLVSGEEGWYKKTFSWEQKNLLKSPKRQVVNIGNDVWIGNKVIIYEGVTIGNGCIINSGSVVIDDVLPYSIVTGNPAQKVKRRFSDDDIALLEKVSWWNLPLEIINQIDKNDFISNLQQLSEKKYQKVPLDKVILKSEEGTIEIINDLNESVLYKI